MKQLIFTLLIMLAITLLGAVSFDEALDSFFVNGYSEEIDGETYWMIDYMYDDRYGAYDEVSRLALLFVFQRLDWDQTAIPEYKEILKATDYIAGKWYDEEDDAVYYVGMSIDEYIWFTDFEYEDDWEIPDMEDEIYDFMNYYGFAFEWEEE
ncbi:MAG: hypothetical protein GX122_01260 [Candidatus Cloacimonetes bacterium]|nr:hypothetical protein [Candidatus Cloacimonadota bacterium]